MSYVLFLRKSETDDWYIINGITFGKVPLDDANEENMKRSINSSLSSQIIEIHNEAAKKYKYYK